VTNEAHDRDWLLISASTAGGAATLRVQVWRKLRSLGALYLQQSVCLLPARPAVVREVRRLADRIRRQGGTVAFRSRFLDYTGVFMLHCHMMNHEEMGMMQAVEVYKD